MRSSSKTETRPRQDKTAAISATINPRLKAHFTTLVKRRIGVLLQMMYMKPEELADLESGEEYICSVCDFDHKRCESEPEYRCETARKLQTELKELELSMDRIRSGNYGFCERCYGFIGKAALEQKLTKTVCDTCAGLS